MRILKKLLLTAGLVGLMGTAGFAVQAKAAITIDDLDVAAGDNSVDIDWFSEDNKTVSIEVYVDGNLAATFETKADEGQYTVEDLLDEINKQGILNKPKSLFNASIRVKIKDPDTGSVLDDADDKENKAFPDATVFKLAVSGTGVLANFDVSNYDDSENMRYYDMTRVYAPEETEATISSSVYGEDEFGGWKLNGKEVSDPYTFDVERDITLVGSVVSLDSFVELTVNNKSGEVSVPAASTISIRWALATSDSPSLDTTKDNVTIYVGHAAVNGTSSLTGGTVSPRLTSSFISGNVYEVYAIGTNENGREWDTRDWKRVYIKIGAKETVDLKLTNESYVTSGYKHKLIFKKTGISGDVSWEMKTSSDADLSGITNNSNSTGNVEVVIEPKVSVSAGSSKDITLNGTYYDADQAKEITKSFTITVYPKPSLSQGSDRTLTITTPAKVNTGTESGGDDDSNKTAFSVSKVKIFGVREDGTNFYSATKEVGDSNKTSFSLDSIMEDANKNLAFNKSQRVTFKIYPADSDANINKKVLSSAEGNIYKITVNGTGIREMGYYGLKGQSLTIQAIPSTGGVFTGYWKDDEKTTSDTRKVTVDGEKTYTAVLGARADSADADSSKLDKVPKTGQSNVFVYIMVVVVIGGAALGLYEYNKKRKSTI